MSHSLVGYMYPFLKYTMFLGQILVGHRGRAGMRRKLGDLMPVTYKLRLGT